MAQVSIEDCTDHEDDTENPLVVDSSLDKSKISEPSNPSRPPPPIERLDPLEDILDDLLDK